MKKFFVPFVIILFALTIFSCSSAQKVNAVFLNPKDSTKNMYLVIQPDSAAVKAYMFLIPSFYEHPFRVLQQTQLPFYAAKQGILTIIPLFSTGFESFGFDDSTQQSFLNILKDVNNRFDVKGKDFFVGGLSIGGTCAIKYAELAIKNNYAIKPKAVFGIDPPLDFERLYNASKRTVRLATNANKKPNEEAAYLINKIEHEMNGTPKTTIKNYYNLSPYSYSDTTQTAIKNLINIPVMLIAEPDIDWWLANRNYDYYSLNVVDLAAMISELNYLGNKNAVLITTHEKGYREPNHQRHPHSWSIADSEKLVSWLLSKK